MAFSNKRIDWKAKANWKAKLFAAKSGVALPITKVGKCTITHTVAKKLAKPVVKYLTNIGRV